MTNRELTTFLGRWLPRIEAEMGEHLETTDEAVARHYGMMRYHMGWADQTFAPQRYPAGKRLRPMLCLLACAANGSDPTVALPAAAAIELLHNFSLIHDDIEDGDEVRRHRPTTWKIWGIPQAINVGDGMYTTAYAAMQRLARRGVSAQMTLDALACFTETCLALTEGQYLDMSFEERNDVTVAEYMRMIHGKTAVLVGASVAIGALLGGATAEQQAAAYDFGIASGLAFQIQDDILGIWGDPAVTGKAAGNDLHRRKKSLPILHTMNHEEVGIEFIALLNQPFAEQELPQALTFVERAGARAYAEAQVRHYFALSADALQRAFGPDAKSTMIWALVESLFHRQA